MSREAFEKWWNDPNTSRRLTDMSEGRAYYIWKAALESQEARCPHIETSGTTSWCRLAAQPQSATPVAVVSGYYAGRPVIMPTDRSMVMREGMPLYEYSAQPKVPEAKFHQAFEAEYFAGHVDGWNACRAAMLTASQDQPK